MKAISLWQPWASLIACGAKPYETRHWAPPLEFTGTTIAIHAAKKIDKSAAEMATELMYGQFDNHGGLAERLEASWGGDEAADDLMEKFGETIMPAGCVVCTVRLEAAFQVGEPDENASVPAARIVRRLAMRPMLEYVNVPYDKFGDYSPGRWAWLLRDVKPLKPPSPVVGHQGFFNLPQGWLVQ
jgi:activating signal cointegrator 1